MSINKTCCILFLLLTVSLYIKAQNSTKHIQLNQSGFYTTAPKIAVVTAPAEDGVFYILSVDKKDTVYKGQLSAPVKSDYSSTTTRIADFSSFNKAGRYILFVKNNNYSPYFSISSNVHHVLSVTSLKAFYYQRVSMPLEKKYAGKWGRATGHPDTIVVIHPSAATTQRPAGYIISSPGGWYDAGDYNNYIVNSGITMGTLLSAYEDFTAYFDTLKTNIPESDNNMPDLLDEALYNLRWMLTMQDPNDGGVYHKCTNARFDSAVMPGTTTWPRYAVQKGTAATLDFAAVMAQAARVYSKYAKQLPGLSDSCKQAALYAWQWAGKNPAVAYDQTAMNGVYAPAVTTGAYGDKYFTDEKFWAACELLITTNDTAYLSVVKQYSLLPLQIPTWSNVHMLGYYSLLRKGTANIYKEAMLKKLLSFSDNLINGGNKAFKTIIGQNNKDFVWGSNAVAMNQSMLLINAFLLSGDKKYITGALSNLDYIMGRNATGFCFVTGLGTASPMHIHHRPSQADGIKDPVPGLLAGGPNPGMQDKCYYPHTETETAYVDDDCAYASNEIAINWNAPLVYVAAAMEALQYKLGLSRR